MIAYELFKVLKNQFGSREAILKTNDLIMEIDYNPKKYINDLTEECEEEGLEQNICPLCGEDLNMKAYDEERGEYQGSPCNETEYVVNCSNPECSYVER